MGGEAVREELRGIWADDSAAYLTDLRHPVMRQEWEQRQLKLGRRPNAAEDLRERRRFDREMVAKYGELCPPPPRTKWQLLTYDIMDQKEERELRQRIAARQPVYERVYVDEEL